MKKILEIVGVFLLVVLVVIALIKDVVLKTVAMNVGSSVIGAPVKIGIMPKMNLTSIV